MTSVMWICSVKSDGSLVMIWQSESTRMVLGVAVCYAFGTIWFMAVTGLNLATSMSYCVIPFRPGDAVKILLAAFLALRLRKPLAAQGFAA